MTLDLRFLRRPRTARIALLVSVAAGLLWLAAPVGRAENMPSATPLPTTVLLPTATPAPTMAPAISPTSVATPQQKTDCDACTPAGLPFEGNAVIKCRFRDPQRPGHTGVDFPLPAYTEVRAAHDGVVTTAKFDPVYGNLVVVSNSRWSTWYAHNAYLLVREGDRVEQGDLLALVGSTGNSTGNHLHYEVHDALDNPRNPEKFLGEAEITYTACITE